MSVYCDWVRWKVWSAASISVWQHVNCLSRSVPEIHLHVAGTLSNQQTTKTTAVSGSSLPSVRNKSLFSLIRQQCEKLFGICVSPVLKARVLFSANVFSVFVGVSVGRGGTINNPFTLLRADCCRETVLNKKKIKKKLFPVEEVCTTLRAQSTSAVISSTGFFFFFFGLFVWGFFFGGGVGFGLFVCLFLLFLFLFFVVVVVVFCVPQLYLWGSPFLGEIFAYNYDRFLNPTIKVVTFRLRGWCLLGVFLLPAFTRLGHERQDLLSPCDEMHVCTD